MTKTHKLTIAVLLVFMIFCTSCRTMTEYWSLSMTRVVVPKIYERTLGDYDPIDALLLLSPGALSCFLLDIVFLPVTVFHDLYLLLIMGGEDKEHSQDDVCPKDWIYLEAGKREDLKIVFKDATSLEDKIERLSNYIQHKIGREEDKKDKYARKGLNYKGPLSACRSALGELRAITSDKELEVWIEKLDSRIFY